MATVASVPTRYVLAFRCIGVTAATFGLMYGEWYTTIPNTIAAGTPSRVLAAIPWLLIMAIQLFTLRRRSVAVNVAHAFAILLAIDTAHLAILAYLYDCNNGYCPMDRGIGNGLDESAEYGGDLVDVVYFFLLPSLVIAFGIVALSPLARIYTCLVAGSALLAVAVTHGSTMFLWPAIPLLALAAIGAIRRANRGAPNDLAT